MRKTCFVLLIASIASLACSSTGPQRVQRRIFEIVVPSFAAPSDSIRITFLDDTGPCDSGARVDAHQVNDTLRIAVSSIPRDDGCMIAIPGVTVQRPYEYFSPPPHPRDLTVVFAEPDGGDIVRVVTVR